MGTAAEEEQCTTSVKSGTKVKAKKVPSGEKKTGKKLKASQPDDIHPPDKGKAKGGKSKGAPPGTRVTKSQKAGIVFPVSRVQRKLRKGKTSSCPLCFVRYRGYGFCRNKLPGDKIRTLLINCYKQNWYSYAWSTPALPPHVRSTPLKTQVDTP